MGGMAGTVIGGVGYGDGSTGVGGLAGIVSDGVGSWTG